MFHRMVQIGAALSAVWMCAGPTQAAWLYWTDKDANLIQRVNIGAETPVEVLLSAGDGLSDPRGIAVDPSGGRMYWAENGTGRIRRANLDGSHIQNLITSGLGFPADVEIDVAGGKLYWADAALGVIRRANLDGTGIEDVRPGLNQPYYLNLDVAGGKMYWGEVANTMIHRANLDGTGAIEDVVIGLVRARDMALDLPNGMIYWADRDAAQIQRRPLAGGAVETLFDASDGLVRPHGLTLDLDAQIVYWADTNAHKVMGGNMDGGSPWLVHYAGAGQPWDIVAVPIPEPAVLLLCMSCALPGLARRIRRRPQAP